MNSLVCGKEEPLQSNEQLTTLDEQTGKLVLATRTVPQLNRYSFVWRGSIAEAHAVFGSLVQRVCRDAGLSVTWVVAWEHQNSGDLKVRSRWRFARRQRSGWTVVNDETLAVATRQVSADDLAVFRPPDFTFRDGYYFSVLGSAPTTQELVDGPPRRSLDLFVRRGILSPSHEMLLWLSDTSRALVYEERDRAGHAALVIAGRIEVPMIEFQSEKVISAVFEGPIAGRVWTFPPSTTG